MLVMILIVDSFDTSQAAVSNNGSPESTKERTKGLCFAKVEVNSSEFSRLFVTGLPGEVAEGERRACGASPAATATC